MASEGTGRPPRKGALLVALATLILPLAGLVLGAPRAAESAPPEPELAAPAEPVAAPLVVAPPARPVVAPPIATPAPTPIAEPEPRNPFPRWTREQYLNFLLVGVDRRSPDEIYRTDTVILANVDLRARRATVISIPRDLVVSIPGFYPDRINAAYALGETNKLAGGGLKLLRDTVERNFMVRIHHYATVDFNCFRGTVDALGGVTLTVPERIHDPSYPTDDYGYKTVTFEPGRHRLDGERALEYARTRYADTDFGRMRRQQQIITALKEQALQVAGLGALPEAARACNGMSSDLSILDLVALGSLARDIRPTDIAFRLIDERMAVPYIAQSGASVLLPRWDEIRAMVRAAIPATGVSLSTRN